MYHLLYLSTARSLFSDDELIALLSTSRKNNQEHDITGILLYCDGAILQVLEGERTVVEKLYIHVQKDKRHHSMLRVITGSSEGRYFGEWSMAFRKMTNPQWIEIAGFLKPEEAQQKNAISASSSGDVFVMIQSFVQANFGPRYML